MKVITTYIILLLSSNNPYVTNLIETILFSFNVYIISTLSIPTYFKTESYQNFVHIYTFCCINIVEFPIMQWLFCKFWPNCIFMNLCNSNNLSHNRRKVDKQMSKNFNILIWCQIWHVVKTVTVALTNNYNNSQLAVPTLICQGHQST